MVLTVGVPAVSKLTYQKLNTTSRQFVGIVKTIRNDAILLNGIYRLGIDFEKQTWWVESQNKFSLIANVADEKPDPKKKKNKKEEKPASNFTYVDKFSKQPNEMPSGVVFDSIYTERSGVVKEGIGYVYFFPNGYNEAAILYMNRQAAKNDPYSLVLQPTTGRVEVFKKKVTGFDGT